MWKFWACCGKRSFFIKPKVSVTELDFKKIKVSFEYIHEMFYFTVSTFWNVFFSETFIHKYPKAMALKLLSIVWQCKEASLHDKTYVITQRSFAQRNNAYNFHCDSFQKFMHGKFRQKKSFWKAETVNLKHFMIAGVIKCLFLENTETANVQWHESLIFHLLQCIKVCFEYISRIVVGSKGCLVYFKRERSVVNLHCLN